MFRMAFAAFFAVLLMGAGLAGAGLFRRTARWELADRSALAILPAAAACFAGLLFHKIHASVFFNLNWVRLQKTFIAASGSPLYYGPGDGPALLTLYPPVSILAYLPATWFPSPFSAVRAAETLNILFFFLPVLGMHIARRPRAPRSLIYAILAFFSFAFLPFLTASLRSAAFHIHADAPTLGLAAAACAILVCARNRKSLLATFFSALFAVLAVWSKQVAAPILLALPTYVLWTVGVKPFIRYLACLALSGAAVSALFIGRYGFNELYFQIITIPASHGVFGKEGLPPLLYAFLKLLTESALIGLVALAAAWARASQKEPARPAGRLRDEPWALLLLVALFMIPTSLLGRVKIGGSANTLSYTTYFLAAAATLAFLGAAREASAKKYLAAVTTALLLVLAPSLYHKFAYPDHGNTDFARAAYEHLKKYPGKTYFPRLLLLHWIVEKKNYHDDFALKDREWAGFPVTGKQLEAYLPSGMEQIAYLKSHEGGAAQPYFREFSLIGEDPDLPGFYVLRRPGTRRRPA
jgi:hypothetical protein